MIDIKNWIKIFTEKLEQTFTNRAQAKAVIVGYKE